MKFIILFLIISGSLFGKSDDYWEVIYTLPEDSIGIFKRMFISDQGGIFAIYGRRSNEHSIHTCYRSKDNGETWEINFHTTTRGFIYQWGEKLLTSINGKFSYSEDDGDTWIQTYPYYGAYSLASIDYAIARKGVHQLGAFLHVSSDSGRTWQMKMFSSTMPPPSLYDVIAGPNDWFYTSFQDWYDENDNTGVHVSKDKGATWERIPGSRGYNIMRFTKNGYLFGMDYFWGIYRSKDYGYSFERLPNADGFGRWLGVNNSDYLFTALRQNNAMYSYFSKDYGETWEFIPDLPGSNKEDPYYSNRDGVFEYVFDKNDFWYTARGNRIFKSRLSTGITEIINIIEDLNLYAYPNPFNPETKINFTIPNNEIIKLDIYNLQGQKIETLLDKKLEQGTHSIEFNASNLQSGIYFAYLKGENFTKAVKLVLIK